MHQDLIDILTIEIPSIQIKPDGFLDITSQGYKENIISRIYGYFLNYDNNREVADLFITSLFELIQEESTKEFDFEDYTCTLEEVTNKGNRIDILIRGNEDKKAIIIENKIYHGLYNDLVDYWNYIDCVETDKVGILLTLNRHFIPNEVKDKYINITHIQWIDRIRQKGLPSGLALNEYVYINDFINSIEKLTKSLVMNEQTRFFFDHTDKVIKAKETYEQAEKYILGQLEIATEKLKSTTNNSQIRLNGNSNHKGYRYIYEDGNHAYYTIVFKDLLTSKKEINIIIELYKDAIAKEAALRAVLKNNVVYESLYLNGHKDTHYVHFATKSYTLNNNEIERLGDFIYEVIKSDFEPVMRIILETLKQ
jgi:hypothetical protein